MTDFAADGLEIKATAGPADGDMRAMFAEFMGAFETFKQANDSRLAELERRGQADVLTEDKLARLNAVLDGTVAIDSEHPEAVQDAIDSHMPASVSAR